MIFDVHVSVDIVENTRTYMVQMMDKSTDPSARMNGSATNYVFDDHVMRMGYVSTMSWYV